MPIISVMSIVLRVDLVFVVIFCGHLSLGSLEPLKGRLRNVKVAKGEHLWGWDNERHLSSYHDSMPGVGHKVVA